jgi:hypothetical protein
VLRESIMIPEGVICGNDYYLFRRFRSFVTDDSIQNNVKPYTNTRGDYKSVWWKCGNNRCPLIRLQGFVKQKTAV